MPNHDGTGPAKGCCNKEANQEPRGGANKEGGCCCENQHRNHGEDESKCCHNGEKHRHHGEHPANGGCCKQQEK